MASTNKTPNIGLNDWLPSDKLDWGDINADNAIIDTAVGNCWNKDNLKIESGTWTPIPPTGVGIDENTCCSYIRIGNLIKIYGHIYVKTKPTTPIELTFGGLPFVPSISIASTSMFGTAQLSNYTLPPNLVGQMFRVAIRDNIILLKGKTVVDSSWDRTITTAGISTDVTLIAFERNYMVEG